jgi:surface protein
MKDIIQDCFGLFYYCDRILNIDFSCFNIKNVTNMSYMFSGCSLKSFPDLSKWKLNKKLKITNMFEGINEEIIPKKFKHCLIF